MRWPIYEHVIFDFDSTLTTVEGIDVLAANAGVGGEVAELTKQAMDGEIKLESVYGKRLETIHPTRGQIRTLREIYRKNLTEDARELIQILLALGRQVYIVSGGLIDPIVEIGIALGVPRDHIKAVDLRYDEFFGEWWLHQSTEAGRKDQPVLSSADTTLDRTHGKIDVVRSLLTGKRGRSILIGDGISDLVTRASVDLFLGYTGVVARDRVVSEAAVLLTCRSLAPALLLIAGPAIRQSLGGGAHAAFVDRAMTLIDEGALRFNEPALESAFRHSYQHVNERTFFNQ